MTFLLGLLSYIPGLLRLVTAITTAAYDAKVKIYQAKTGTIRDVAVAAIDAEVLNNQTKVSWMATVASSPILSFVVVGFSFPFIFYLNKVIVWDLCLDLGSTPTLKYALLEQWGGVIIGGIFVTTGGIGITHAIINKDN